MKGIFKLEYHVSYLFHGVAVLLVLLLYSPYVLYYDKAYFPTGCDNLNGLPPFMFSSISEILASNDYVISRFGEAKRFCFPSEFYPMVWFIYFFGPLNYIIFISISSGLVSYIGSWLLLEKHVYPFFDNKFNLNISDNERYWLLFSPSIYFALLPNWWYGQYSIHIGPLVFYTIINICKNKDSVKDWLVLIITPFVSNPIFYGFFLIVFLILLIVLFMIYHKRVFIKPILAVLMMMALYFLIEYRLVESVILSNTEHQRDILHKGHIRNLSVWGHIKETMLFIMLKFFDFVNTPVISFGRNNALLILVFFLVMNILHILRKQFRPLAVSLMFFFSGLLLVALKNQGLIKTILISIFPSLKTAILGITLRFDLFSSFFWMVFLFVIGYFSIILDKRIVKIFTIMNIVYLILLVGFTDKYLFRLGDTIHPFYNNFIENKKALLSYDNVTDVDFFKEIENSIQKDYHLDKKDYKIMCPVFSVLNDGVEYFGPFVTQINGFQNIDGYLSMWNHDYYQKFQQLLDTNFYPDDGRKLYFKFNKNLMKNDTVLSLRLNNVLFKQLNCKFIFSPYVIMDHSSVKYYKTFKGKVWKIHIYEIK